MLETRKYSFTLRVVEDDDRAEYYQLSETLKNLLPEADILGESIKSDQWVLSIETAEERL